MEDANLEKDLILLARVRDGDESAREELLRKYTPLVRSIVRRYAAVGLETDDLVQEGLIGLLGAMGEYRHEPFGVKFSSFAYLCVIRRIFNVIRQSNNNKHKALNSAVPLQPRTPGEGRLPIIETRACPNVDPEALVEERISRGRLDDILKTHLSTLEYAVVFRLASGYSTKEIEAQLNLSAKAVDNARTRAKRKITRITRTYGSLLDPMVPRTARRRYDLSLDLPAVRNHHAGPLADYATPLPMW